MALAVPPLAQWDAATLTVRRAAVVLHLEVAPKNITVGGGPMAVAANPKGTYLYVANYGTGTVSVINLAKDEVTTTITVGYNPTDVAVSPDGRYVYVTSSFSGVAGPTTRTLSIIDTAKNTVAKKIGVGDSNGVAFGPTGKYAYVTSNVGVSIIDTATQELIGSIPVGAGLDSLVVSPDGRTLYVDTGYINNGSSLFAVNIASRRVEATIKEDLLPMALAVNSGSRGVYEAFNDEQGVAVKVISTATNSVAATVRAGHGGNGLALSPNGRYAYLTDPGGDALTVIDTTTRAVTNNIHIPNGLPGTDPWAVAISPDGRHAYVTNFDYPDFQTDGTVTVVDLPRS